MFRICNLFAIAAEEGNLIIVFYCLELGLDRLVVSHTFRILAFCDSADLLWHHKFLLFHYLEVANHVDSSFWCNQGQLVELVVLKELVGDLDYSLASVKFAGEVDADGDLILYSFEVKDIESLIYIFRRDMVQYGTILQCAYY